jgi:hypothetical protein
VVVETRTSPETEPVGRAFDAAVARILAPEPRPASARPPDPAPTPSVVTSIVIGRIELTAAPPAPPRTASPTKAPMSLDEYLSRRGQAGR